MPKRTTESSAAACNGCGNERPDTPYCPECGAAREGWEYRVFKLAQGVKTTEQHNRELAALGTQGWEAVGITGDLLLLTVLLKRRLEAQ